MRCCLSVLITLVVLPSVSLSADPKGDVKLTSAEQKILDLTNQARQKEKLPPLKFNPVLTQVARKHSENMARQGKMEHELDGKRPAERVEAAGYRYKRVGENIAYSSELLVDTIFDGWMKSPGHRENILRDSYREIGIGIATNAQGEVYYTQVFGTLMGAR